MSSRFENVCFLILFSWNFSLWIDFGIFGVGIFSWSESISVRVDVNSLRSCFFRSCFCLSRTFRLWSFFRVLRRSAWLIRMFDLFVR